MKKYLKPKIAVQDIESAAFLEEAISNYDNDGDGDQLSNEAMQDQFENPSQRRGPWDDPKN
jgi:hypothetical protein